ncbi:MAG: hypothetical protein LBQ43_01385 [Holosporales bacterium]|jgi:hypothetical protein|nr:hypothetical protein [Holosporales bacterium]
MKNMVPLLIALASTNTGNANLENNVGNLPMAQQNNAHNPPINIEEVHNNAPNRLVMDEVLLSANTTEMIRRINKKYRYGEEDIEVLLEAQPNDTYNLPRNFAEARLDIQATVDRITADGTPLTEDGERQVLVFMEDLEYAGEITDNEDFPADLLKAHQERQVILTSLIADGLPLSAENEMLCRYVPIFLHCYAIGVGDNWLDLYKRWMGPPHAQQRTEAAPQPSSSSNNYYMAVR